MVWFRDDPLSPVYLNRALWVGKRDGEVKAPSLASFMLAMGSVADPTLLQAGSSYR